MPTTVKHEVLKFAQDHPFFTAGAGVVATWPILEKVLGDLGIPVPKEKETLLELWKGLVPHMMDLMAVWASVRVGFRIPDWIGGGAEGGGGAPGGVARGGGRTGP